MKRRLAILFLAGLFSIRAEASAQHQWTEPEQITFDGTSIDPRVAAIDNSIYIVAMHVGARFLKSSDFGQSWTEPVIIAPSLTYSSVPDVACTDEYVHVVLSGRPESEHYRTHIMVVSSEDGGDSWGEPRIVFRGNDNINKLPEIAAEGDMVFAAAEIHSKLVFKRSRDNGFTWSDSTMLEENGIDHWPVMISSGQYVHIIYEYNPEPLMTDICYRRSSDFGETWSDRVYLSDHEGVPSPYRSMYPSITAGQNGELLVLWGESESDSRDLIETISFDNGATWSEATQITFGHRIYESSSLILGGMFYAIWPDYDFDLPFHRRIAYSESDDFGETWMEPVIISGNDDENDYNPSLLYTVVDSDTVFHCITRRNALYYFNNSPENTGVYAQADGMPSSIHLSAYPNPFNSKTTITFDILAQGNVEISVYNLLGQRVSVLLKDRMSPGTYHLEWNAQGLSSGMYTINFQSRDVNDDIRITLLK